MISNFSDLTTGERSLLAQAALDEAALSNQPARWHEIASAIENGGKQPHAIEPGRWVPIADAGTGGPC
jgi:hypothetical protein